MSIEMIVTDLDRTLLRSDKTVSGYTARILALCRRQGIKVVFATARPKRTVTHFVGDVPVDAVILHNGAIVYAEDILIGSFGIASDVKNDILLSISRIVQMYHRKRLFYCILALYIAEYSPITTLFTAISFLSPR